MARRPARSPSAAANLTPEGYPRAVGDERVEVGRAAIGAACAIFDDRGRVLLVHRTYGRLNWELPGGVAEPGEAPAETALHELFEETGLRPELDRLSGVYFEADHEFGPMLHFVFRCRWDGGLAPVSSSAEIGDLGYWPLDDLPTPISDFTERRVRDAAADAPAKVVAIATRQRRS
jgi:8-oxo-dGTP diphosphatase